MTNIQIMLTDLMACNIMKRLLFLTVILVSTTGCDAYWSWILKEAVESTKVEIWNPSEPIESIMSGKANGYDFTGKGFPGGYIIFSRISRYIRNFQSHTQSRHKPAD